MEKIDIVERGKQLQQFVFSLFGDRTTQKTHGWKALRSSLIPSKNEAPYNTCNGGNHQSKVFSSTTQALTSDKEEPGPNRRQTI